MLIAAKRPVASKKADGRAVVSRAIARSPRSKRIAESTSGTREVLIREAMKLFADRAIGAVSLREIVQKAGQGNQSAIRYHFKDKQGLVDAVAEHVQQIFQPYYDAALADVRAADEAGTLGTEDLVTALVMPVVLVFHANETGRDAIRFLAKLASDGGDVGQSLLLSKSASYVIEIERLLAKRLPRKPREKLWLQMLLCLSSTLFGLTALGGLRFSPFGNNAPLYPGRRDELIRDYVHFVSRGVLGD